MTLKVTFADELDYPWKTYLAVLKNSTL